MSKNKTLHWLTQILENISFSQVVVLSILLATYSVWYHHGGILHPEMERRLPFYLSSKPLLAKLYDSRVLDDDLFRARELSYFFDYIDSNFFEFTVYMRHPQFLSITHYLFALATGYVLWFFCLRELKLSPVVSLGLIVLFWTSPSVFLGGDIFRTGKIGVTLLTSLLYYFLYQLTAAYNSETDLEIANRTKLGLFLAMLGLSLFDEQGLFLNITIIIYVGILALNHKRHSAYIVLQLCVGAILTHEVYRFIIAPRFTLLLNGYWPNFSYEQLPLSQFFQHLPLYLTAGTFLFIETFRFLIGSPPWLFGALLFISSVSFPILYRRYHSTSQRVNSHFFNLIWLNILIANCFLVVGMNALMVLRHPSLVWPQITILYYWLPTNIMLVMTLAIFVKFVADLKISPTWIAAALMLACLCNILAKPVQKATLQQGYLLSAYHNSPALLEALASVNSGAIPTDPLITENSVYKMFESNIH